MNLFVYSLIAISLFVAIGLARRKFQPVKDFLSVDSEEDRAILLGIIATACAVWPLSLVFLTLAVIIGTASYLGYKLFFDEDE